MKKCPEKNILIGFIEKDLRADELEEFETHLKTCHICKAEVEHFKVFDRRLRNEFSVLAGNSSLSEKIIGKIKSEPAPERNNSRQLKSDHRISFFSHFKPFLAFCILAVIFLGVYFNLNQSQDSSTKSAVYYNGITFVALSEGSTFGNSNVKVGIKNRLPLSFPIEISGKFSFSVNQAASSSFQLDGKAKITGLSSGLPVFDDSSAEFAWMAGDRIVLSVNSRQMTVEPTNISTKQENDFEQRNEEFSDLEPYFFEILDLTERVYDDCNIFDYMDSCLIAPSTATSAASVNLNNSKEHADKADVTQTDSATITDLNPGPGKNPFVEETLELGGN